MDLNNGLKYESEGLCFRSIESTLTVTLPSPMHSCPIIILYFTVRSNTTFQYNLGLWHIPTQWLKYESKGVVIQAHVRIPWYTCNPIEFTLPGALPSPMHSCPIIISHFTVRPNTTFSFALSQIIPLHSQTKGLARKGLYAVVRWPTSDAIGVLLYTTKSNQGYCYIYTSCINKIKDNSTFYPNIYNMITDNNSKYYCTNNTKCYCMPIVSTKLRRITPNVIIHQFYQQG